MDSFADNGNHRAGRIGEKFQEWTDETPSLTKILDSITLYWFTESFPRCIYTYREVWRWLRCPFPRVPIRPHCHT
jgi:hypothetical protein